jgi:osmoprotectant transport system permease protein
VTFWEYLGNRHQQLITDAYQHASAVFQCTVVATALGVLIGVVTYRSEWAGTLATTATSTVLSIPSLAMIGLLVPVVGLGVTPTVIALTLYGLLPIVRNSVVGLRGVDPSLVDAAKGIGMSRIARLLRVELPPAWPPILTGVRVSTQMLMGIAAIAAYASGPGLGNVIFRGLASLGSANALNQVLAGTLGIIVLALLFDAAYVLIGRLTIPGGQRGAGRGDRAARRVHGRGRHGDAHELRARTAGGRPARGHGGPARTGGGPGPPDARRAGGRWKGEEGVTTAEQLEEAPAEQRETDAPKPPSPPKTKITWQKLTLLPAFLVAVLLATWLWFQQTDLDSTSENALSNGQASKALWQHVELTVISTFFVLIIAIPLGTLLTRKTFRKASPVAMAVADRGQATPAIGLLALLVIWLGIGREAALIGIISYAVLPVLSHTIAGLKANEPTLLEAARGIGMSPLGVLAKVELPLAVPLILAGVRTALVLNVGTATLAVFGGGGGLGVLITTGITSQGMPVLVLGSVLTVALALLVDWLASLAELLLRPRGLEVGP